MAYRPQLPNLPLSPISLGLLCIQLISLLLIWFMFISLLDELKTRMNLFLCLHNIYMGLCVQSLSCVWLLVTPQTAAHWVPLSMEFSRQEHSSGLPFPPQGTVDIQWNISHKKNKIMPSVTPWIDIEGIMLSEASQREKDNTLWSLFHVASNKEKESLQI